MKILNLKNLLLAVLAASLLIICPLVVNANEGENVAILKNSDGEYIVYLKDINTDFKFVISQDINSIDYINSALDNNNNQVAYTNIENGVVYLSAKTLDNQPIIEKYQINLDEDAVTVENIDAISTYTKRIAVDTTKSKTISEVKDNTTYTTTVGLIKITDDINATYSYITKSISSDELMNEFVNLNDQLEIFNNMNTFEKINFIKRFNEVYENIINNNIWNNVENFEISEPEEVLEGDKYVVFIKKDNGETVVYDYQIMTAHQEKAQDFASDKITIKEAILTPKTFDSIIISIIILSLAIGAYVVVLKNKKNK